jgi:hypothetical protein
VHLALALACLNQTRCLHAGPNPNLAPNSESSNIM